MLTRPMTIARRPPVSGAAHPGKSAFVLAGLFLVMGVAFGFLRLLVGPVELSTEKAWFLLGVQSLSVIFLVASLALAFVGFRRGRSR